MNLEKHALERYAVWVIYALILVVLLAVPTMRMVNQHPIIPGSQAYDDIHNAALFWAQGIHPVEAFSLDNAPITLEPFQIAIAPLVHLTTNPWAFVILQVLLGITSLYFLYALLVHFNLSKLEIRMMFVVFVVVPSFLFSFGAFSSHGLVIALTLATLYFLLCKQQTWIALIFAVLASILSVTAALVLLFILLYISDRLPEFHQRTNLLTGAIVVAAAAFTLTTQTFPALSIPLKLPSVLSAVVTDLGAPLGFSVFSVVLAILGIVYTWNFRELKYVYTLLIILFVVSTTAIESLIFISLGSALFGGYALARLISHRWQSLFLKEFTLLLIVFGLLFSIIAYSDRIVAAEPTRETEQALVWVAQNTNVNSVILTHESRNPWVHEWASRPTISETTIVSLDQLWYSRDLEKTQILFNDSQVSYVYIDEEMRNDLIWTKHEGLLLLLENNETFKSVYAGDGREVWEYLYRP